MAILFFGLIIGIHEFGHFISAKIFGVRVHEFALGMGPAIFKKKKGETQYALRLFPIGGYVNMEGEDEESDDEGAFCKKKWWQKLIIVAAGAIMNLILGLIFVTILTCMDDLVGTTQIHSFHENATSVQYGLEAGDTIKKINGTNIYSSRDISYALQRDEDGIYDFVVNRNGEKIELKDVHFEQKDIKKDPLLVTPIGICMNYYEQRNNFIVVKVNEDHIKLYDNGNLTVADAAMQYGISTLACGFCGL